MKSWFLVAALAFPAVADSFKSIERKDWVADWNKYVEKHAMSGGKMLHYFSPAPTARREILPRELFNEEVAAGRRQAVGAGVLKIVTDLLKSPPLSLKRLEVVDLDIDDQKVRSLEISGESVLAFWTTPHSNVKPDGTRSSSSTLYLQGRNPGHSELRVTLADGKTKLLMIDVP